MSSRPQTGTVGHSTHDGQLLSRAPAVGSKMQLRLGWLLSAFVGLFMIFDGVIKLVPIAAVAQTLGPLGFPTDAGFERGLGLLGLVCTILFIVPRTSILGAVLMTGYLGGAIASQLRVGNPLFSHLLFGVYLGLFAWAGLWLRIPALRTMLPLKPVDGPQAAGGTFRDDHHAF